MIDYAKRVLAGIVPNRVDNLGNALIHLEVEHFRDETYRTIFRVLEAYYNLTSYVVTAEAFSDMLANTSAETTKILHLESVFTELVNTHVADHEFRYAIDGLKDERARQLTGEAVTAGFEVLEQGLEVAGVQLRGHKDARQFIVSEFSKIDHLDNIELAPEGDMRTESEEILAEYADRKSGKIPEGVRTGIPQIDEVTAGIQPGELVLVTAYTGQGKTQMVSQTAWNAATQLGVNVFFATSETVRVQVRRRIVARHSKLPQFEYPEGLDTNDIKLGRLTEAGEKVLQDVLHDLRTNPAYGKIYIAQVPRGATLSFVESRLRRQGQLYKVGLAIMDYLALLKPDIKRNNEREEFNAIIRDAKMMANSFHDGAGVPLMSPWAMSQSSYTRALERGHYTLANLADTSEAEKSADQIWAMLRRDETPETVKFQMLKNRDGDTLEPFDMTVDYRCTYLGPKVNLFAASFVDADEDYGSLGYGGVG